MKDRRDDDASRRSGAPVEHADDRPAAGRQTLTEQIVTLDPAKGTLPQPGTSYAWKHSASAPEPGAVGQPQGAQSIADSQQASAGTVQLAPAGLVGRMGPGGGTGLPGPPNPQLDAFKYFEKHGRAHITELMQTEMGPLTLATGSPFAVWEGGSSKHFVAAFSHQLFAETLARPWDLAENTLAPTSLWQLIETGRDAGNKDAPAKANEYQLGVTLELEKAYRERLREALTRLTPRVIQEWNRRTLADHAERARHASTPIPEHPESNQPGVGILQSHPIDRYVLAALWGLTRPVLVPDFAAYRKAFPSEAKPHGSRDTSPAELRNVKFAWQSPNHARHWIKVTDPIDATAEEVAKELFGDTLLTYLVTPAPPLFGLDVTKHSLVARHETAYQKLSGDRSPGGSVAHQILAGPQSDDAALDQAAGFTAGKTSSTAVLQQLDLLIHQLRTIATSAASWVTLDKDVQEAIARTERRQQQLASVKDPHEAERWNAQIREQLDIAGKCETGLSITSKLFHAFEAPEPRDLAWQIGTLFVQAAASSDLIVTARQQLDRANQRLLAFPADWVEAQFRWIRRAVLASQTRVRSGKDDAFVTQLGDKEAKLRGELMKVRDQLLTNPLAVQDELDRITKEMQQLATGAAAVRNIELCDEVFVQLKDARSPTGWIRGLASNPVTGNHGNERLDALAQRAEKFQGEWAQILKQWKSGDQRGAAAALDAKTQGDTEWTKFFHDVARETKDQATYDAWMTFGLMVGIAIITGFAGAVIEPAIVGALGPILGFVVSVTTDAAMFTTMSYFLVDKHPSLQGFKNDFAHNVMTFGVLKGVSKAWGALEKLVGTQMKTGEMIAQFAMLNGIALYQANQEKARKGETLTEGEILKISFDNLLFLIAVSIGSKAVAPAFGRWRLRGAVAKQLDRFESLHQEVTDLAEAVKTSKDKGAAEKLLDRQRGLLEAERELLEALVELTSKGWEHARKQGMTREQFDGVAAARNDLAEATRGLREAEIMSRLEPVTRNQYLSDPGKPFDDAHEHYAGDKASKVGNVATDPATGARSFEVTLPDGSTLRISERAGAPGEVGTRTKRVTTAGGEPPPPRAEEVASAHGIDPAHAATFEALYQAHPRELLAFLEALRGRPELANRLLARFGESVLTHFKPTGSDMLDLHGEIQISAGKLADLSIEDLGKLVEVARNKGPEKAYQYFESTSESGGKPGARLRFTSRLAGRAKEVAKNIRDSLEMRSSDPRAQLLDSMNENDAARLWDLFNEEGYQNADIRRQAADWAFRKSPKNVRDLVAEMQFYNAEVRNQASKLISSAKSELATELEKKQAAKGTPLNDAEVKSVTRMVTAKHLGRSLDVIARAAERAGIDRAVDHMAQIKHLADGSTTTVGADAADTAWNTNTAAQSGVEVPGPKHIGTKTDAELPSHVRSIADTLNFGTRADGAYHAHKHATEIGRPTTPATEMTDYLTTARQFIRDKPGVVRQNQNGSRSIIVEANGMRAIVMIGIDGNVAIATFGRST